MGARDDDVVGRNAAALSNAGAQFGNRLGRDADQITADDGDLGSAILQQNCFGQQGVMLAVAGIHPQPEAGQPTADDGFEIDLARRSAKDIHKSCATSLCILVFW